MIEGGGDFDLAGFGRDGVGVFEGVVLVAAAGERDELGDAVEGGRSGEGDAGGNGLLVRVDEFEDELVFAAIQGGVDAEVTARGGGGSVPVARRVLAR